MRPPDRASERRLEDLRREAAAVGRVDGRGVAPAGAPFPRADAAAGYYGMPLLKPPTWKWEIPLYFFTGGAAGAAAVVGTAARHVGGDERLSRHARWIAAVGGAASAPLLISDLGRPERFLAMLRIFKPQSPMSVGAWTLTAFSSAAAAAAFADLAVERFGAGTPVRIVGDAAGMLSAATGLVMASYTGVLLGVTTIPVWAESVDLLPHHFAASGVASAVALLELLGHRGRALHWLAMAAAAMETATGGWIEMRNDPVFEPLKKGKSGTVVRAGGVLSGPVPLLLRLCGARTPAAWASIVGSLLTRYGWLQAGRASAHAPRIPLELPAAPSRQEIPPRPSVGDAPVRNEP